MRPTVIVGGGLAGLTLGILLRRSNVPVQLWEAGDYPRHRVCGEFISGRGGAQLLEMLPGLKGQVRPLQTVRFFHAGASTASAQLPSAGLSISRWDLDDALATEFKASGGELVARRWLEGFETPGVVRANGRRRGGNGETWTGLKAHAEEFELTADLEMHFSVWGYLGISRLPSGVNVCALVNERAPISDFRQNPSHVLQQLAASPQTARQLASANFARESLCAVSGISFSAPEASAECCVGDAIRMIPPFTGNGMSLAIESAFAAAPHLTEYSDGQLDWPETVRRVRGDQDKRFRRRFVWANGLRRLADRSWTRHGMLSILRTAPRMLSICFWITRS